MNQLEQELLQYQNDLGPVGEYARELLGILNDYSSGAITAEEKNELVEEVLNVKAANSLANHEQALRWVYMVGTGVASVV